MTILSRRSALTGSLATLFAAPAIVRASSLMPVSVRVGPAMKPAWTVMDRLTNEGEAFEDVSRMSIKNIGAGRIMIGKHIIEPGEEISYLHAVTILLPR